MMFDESSVIEYMLWWVELGAIPTSAPPKTRAPTEMTSTTVAEASSLRADAHAMPMSAMTQPVIHSKAMASSRDRMSWCASAPPTCGAPKGWSERERVLQERCAQQPVVVLTLLWGWWGLRW